MAFIRAGKKNLKTLWIYLIDEMEKILTLFFCIILQTGYTQSFETGIKYYENKKYNEAIEAWKTDLNHNPSSATICFNIGNAYFESKNYPEAIFYFRKAFKLNPQLHVAEDNLKLAQSISKIDDLELPGQNFQKFIIGIANAISTRWLLIIYLILSTLGIWIWKISKIIRKPTLGMVLFCLGMLMLVPAAIQQYLIQSDKEAIVMSESPLYISPDINSEHKTSCKAGEELSITDYLGDWVKVQTHSFESGWIQQDRIRNLLEK